MLHHDNLGGGSWETYNGTTDGIWTQVIAGAGYEVGGLGVYPLATAGTPAIGAISVDASSHNGSVITAQRLALGDLTVSATGSVKTMSYGYYIYGCDLSVSDAAWCWGADNSWQGASHATGWTHDGTGMLAGSIGGGLAGNGNFGTCRPLDATRAIFTADGTTWGKGCAIHTRAGGSLGSIGGTYTLASGIANFCTALPCTASLSLAAYGGSGGTLALVGLSHAATTITQAVAPVSLAASGFDNYSAALCGPVDGFGAMPARYIIAWWTGSSLQARMVGYDGAAITLGTTVTLAAALGSWFSRPHSLLAMGGGIAMLVSSTGQLYPLYYNAASVTDLTLTPSPRVLASGPLQVATSGGPTSGMMATALSPNRLMLAGPTGSGVSAKIVSNGLM